MILVILEILKTKDLFFYLAFIELHPATGRTKVNESGETQSQLSLSLTNE